MYRCSVVTFDQAEEVFDAALIKVECVDMPEIVIEEDLDSVRILTQLGGDLRPPSGYLSDFLGLLLLELDLECSHVYRPIIAAAPRCAATSDISPRRALPLPPRGDGRTEGRFSCAARAGVANLRCLKPSTASRTTPAKPRGRFA